MAMKASRKRDLAKKWVAASARPFEEGLALPSQMASLSPQGPKRIALSLIWKAFRLGGFAFQRWKQVVGLSQQKWTAVNMTLRAPKRTLLVCTCMADPLISENPQKREGQQDWSQFWQTVFARTWVQPKTGSCDCQKSSNKCNGWEQMESTHAPRDASVGGTLILQNAMNKHAFVNFASQNVTWSHLAEQVRFEILQWPQQLLITGCTVTEWLLKTTEWNDTVSQVGKSMRIMKAVGQGVTHELMTKKIIFFVWMTHTSLLTCLEHLPTTSGGDLLATKWTDRWKSIVNPNCW